MVQGNVDFKPAVNRKFHPFFSCSWECTLICNWLQNFIFTKYYNEINRSWFFYCRRFFFNKILTFLCNCLLGRMIRCECGGGRGGGTERERDREGERGVGRARERETRQKSGGEGKRDKCLNCTWCLSRRASAPVTSFASSSEETKAIMLLIQLVKSLTKTQR